MARYIDADALARDVLASWDKDKHKTFEASGVHRQEHHHLMRIIEKQPTADVAPRSELAILSVQNAALEKAKFELQQELEAYKGLKKILDTCAAELKKKYIGEQK